MSQVVCNVTLPRCTGAKCATTNFKIRVSQYYVPGSGSGSGPITSTTNSYSCNTSRCCCPRSGSGSGRGSGSGSGSGSGGSVFVPCCANSIPTTLYLRVNSTCVWGGATLTYNSSTNCWEGHDTICAGTWKMCCNGNIFAVNFFKDVFPNCSFVNIDKSGGVSYTCNPFDLTYMAASTNCCGGCSSITITVKTT